MREIFEVRPTAGPSRVVGAGRAPRAGFTLVEMLMVILIISLLMALLLPVIGNVKTSAVKASIKMDVNELVTALNAFKAKYGSYPPSRNWTVNEIATFVHRAFPRYNPTAQSDFDTTVAFIKNLDEAESLVFWLGGRWDPQSGHLTGLPADPKADPFVIGGQRNAPFLQFDEKRLQDRNNNRFPEYFPPNISINQAVPYVYFAARPNQKYWKVDDATGNPASPTLPMYQPLDANSQPMNTAASPYHFKQVDNPSNTTQSFWVNPTGFQIICAGIDNDYGGVPGNPVNKVFPDGTNYTSADIDNIVSFTEKTLGDAKP